jgi:hypothetical protein
VFESLLTFFAIGTWGFLVALAALAVAITIFAEEDGAKATITLILGALFLQFIARFDLLEYIREQPFTLLAYAGLYVAVGAGWSVLKWRFYVKSQRRIYDQLRKAFCAEHDITADFTDDQKRRWVDYLESHYRVGRGPFRHYSSSSTSKVIPDVTENKAAILRWMTYWPFSMLFTLLNDPVRRLFEWVYESLGKTLQAMANRAFRGTENDLPARVQVSEASDGHRGPRQR